MKILATSGETVGIEELARSVRDRDSTIVINPHNVKEHACR